MQLRSRRRMRMYSSLLKASRWPRASESVQLAHYPVESERFPCTPG